MIDTNRVTDALPVVSCGASPAHFENVDYSPSLLLPARFSPDVVETSLYGKMCMVGFNSYFEDMYRLVNGQAVFFPRTYTWAEIVQVVIEETMDQREESASFVVGFLHGWLSALALTDRQSALMALEVVCQLFPGQCC